VKDERWQVGSDFESASIDILNPDAGTSPPWESRWNRINYFESGRQALYYLALLYAKQGRSELLLPGLFCDSMIEPFLAAGYEIKPIPVGDDLLPLEGPQCKYPETSLILSIKYFGRPEGDAWSSAVTEQRSMGAAVISDDSHSLFDPPTLSADWRVASLRKTLPLPDGAFLIDTVTLDAVESDYLGTVDTQSPASSIREKAMQAKSSWLNGFQTLDFRALFMRAEKLTESTLMPHGMSESARGILERLDFAAIASRRRSNATVIGQGLDGTQYTSLFGDYSGPAFTPSHLVIRGPAIMQLRSYLAKRQVYCPVHWPMPELLPVQYPWPDGFMSIPIDQRYDEPDMQRVVKIIKEFKP
jgi:hypothetical protein